MNCNVQSCNTHSWCLHRLKQLFKPELSFNISVHEASWWGHRFRNRCLKKPSVSTKNLFPSIVNAKKSVARVTKHEKGGRELRIQQDAGYWWWWGMCQESQTQRWWKFHDLVKTNTHWHDWVLGKQIEHAMGVQKLSTLTTIYLFQSI